MPVRLGRSRRAADVGRSCAFETQVRLRWSVYEEWGFARLAHLGHGISALFGGPSGTGKTMAAQVMARALGLELYRVDLAGVVNKYIGETEKRLRDVFDACERPARCCSSTRPTPCSAAACRSKDAHDRFANIEIDYLLQRIERFDGVAILATNRKNDLDAAFLRRLRFVVEFLPPRPAERLALWHGRCCRRRPSGEEILDDIDWSYLAERLQLTGADIKAAALGAAFLARAEGERIGMRHVLAAAQRELTKQGARCACRCRRRAMMTSRKSQQADCRSTGWCSRCPGLTPAQATRLAEDRPTAWRGGCHGRVQHRSACHGVGDRRRRPGRPHRRGAAAEAGCAMAGKYLRGALIEFTESFPLPIPNVIIFQFNPETMTHTWTPATTAASTPGIHQQSAGDHRRAAGELLLHAGDGRQRHDRRRRRGGRPRHEQRHLYAARRARNAAVSHCAAGGGLGRHASPPRLASAASLSVRRPPGARRRSCRWCCSSGAPAASCRCASPQLTITEKLYDRRCSIPTHAEAQIALARADAGGAAVRRRRRSGSSPRPRTTYSQGLRQALALANLANAVESIIGMLPI